MFISCHNKCETLNTKLVEIINIDIFLQWFQKIDSAFKIFVTWY
jgi:hypothetical protein